ncbi:MAG: serine/threonine-protein kinase [Planctomycetota bacterium]
MERPSIAKAREIFAGALELPLSERAAFVSRQCGDEPALCDEIHSLLSEHERLGPFLETPALNRRAPPAPPGNSACSSNSVLADAPSLSCRERLGDFEIESLIGHGGFGEVYRGRQLSLGRRPVALKVLRQSQCPGLDRQRLLREARIVSDIHHPHLVEVYSCGEDAERGLVYYAMRLVDGPNLNEILQELVRSRTRPSGQERRSLVQRFLEISQALATLHSHGLVHRDVKPANIIIEGNRSEEAPITSDGSAVLVDFGLVKPVASTVSTLWATPVYAAPEQLEGHCVDARADVYSLGLCMYDLLSAQGPGQRHAQTHGELEPLRRVVPETDADLEAIVARATERDPRHRYGDAAALASDIEAWLAGLPVTARPLRGFERVKRWVRHHPERVLRWVARGAGASVVAAAVLLAALRSGEIVAASSRCKTSWRAGDLVAVQRQLDRIPSVFDRLLLDGDLAGIASSLRSLQGNDARVEVTRMILTEGEEQAALHAARILEHDGLGGHRVLASFLLRMLAESPAERPRRRGVELVARLFYEHPAEDPRAISCSTPFRHRLLELLGNEHDSYTRLHVLTALSGCATPRDMPQILATLASRVAERSPLWKEETRLGFRISRSSHAVASAVHSCTRFASSICRASSSRPPAPGRHWQWKIRQSNR